MLSAEESNSDSRRMFALGDGKGDGIVEVVSSRWKMAAMLLSGIQGKGKELEK